MLVNHPYARSVHAGGCKLPWYACFAVFLLVSFQAVATDRPGFPDPFAKGVADAQNITSPDFALGAPDHKVAAFAAHGELLLDLGSNPLNRLSDGIGDDLLVIERLENACTSVSEAEYEVAVANDPAGPFMVLGTVSGQRSVGDSFDLDGSGMSNARYVRLRASNVPLGIDGIVLLNMVRGDAVRAENAAPLIDVSFDGIASTPVVGNLDDDASPEIVVTAQTGRNQCEAFVIDGATHTEDLRITYPAGCTAIFSCFCGNTSAPAIGDVDNDGEPEIVLYQTVRSRQFDFTIYEADGTEIVRTNPSGGGTSLSPVLENLDDDPELEILWQGGYLESDGTNALSLPNSGLFAKQPVAVDLDNDGAPELVLENASTASVQAVEIDGTEIWSTDLGNRKDVISRPAIADLDGDGSPEIIVQIIDYPLTTFFVQQRSLVALTADGSVMWRTDLPTYGGFCSVSESVSCTQDSDCPATEACEGSQTNGEASRPAVADLDGDGNPEIAVFVRNQKVGEDVVVAFDGDGTELWRVDARDPGGTPPAVSAADLNGDGMAEVLWNGNCSGFTIMSGADGRILYRDARASSGSGLDYPVSADVDGDGRMEVATGSLNGLWIFGNDQAWTEGRSVWNHLDYRITNVEDDLSVPAQPDKHWLTHNSYLTQTAIDGPRRPLADAGADRTITTEDVIILDGSGSRDNDTINGGQQPTWRWDLDIFTDSSGDGIPDNDIDATGAQLTKSYTAPGIFPAKLTYTDDDGARAQDFAVIEVTGGQAPAGVYCGHRSGRTIVAWNTDVDAVGYVVRRHQGNGYIEFPETGANRMEDTGLVENQAYAYTVQSRLADGSLSPMSQPCSVTPPPAIQSRTRNRMPRFRTRPDTLSAESEPYSYVAAAIDPDRNNPLRYDLAAGPASIVVDSTTGELVWIPDQGDSGHHIVTLTATDQLMGRSAQSWLLKVAAQNRAPRIISAPPIQATDGELFSYQVEAVDPNPGDTLTYSVLAGPRLLNLDARTGLLTWTPDDPDVGLVDISLQVTDDRGLSTVQSFQVGVFNTPEAPFITSTRNPNIGERFDFIYAVKARDPDIGEPLAWFLTEAPEGMTIDTVSGDVFWGKPDIVVGTHTVEITVVDPSGASDTQTLNLVVRNFEDAPSFTSTPVIVAGENAEYRYPATAEDRDAGAVLTFDLLQSPVGMTVDPVSGVVTWLPDASQIGLHTVELAVTDETSRADTQTFDVEVFAAADLLPVPDVVGTSEADAQLALTAVGFALGPQTATYSPQPAGDVLSQDPAAGAVQPLGFPVALVVSEGPAPSIVPNVVGLTRAEAEAAVIAAGLTVGNVTVEHNNEYDIGLVYQQEFVPGTELPGLSEVAIEVSAGIDRDPPVIDLRSPGGGSVITTLADVTGSVEADDLDFYRVEIAPADAIDDDEYAADDPDWRLLAEGNAEIDGVLGQVDPTVLANDAYLLRLLARDRAGNRTYAVIGLSVDGNTKLGQYSVSFLDMEVPVSGRSIRIERVYESFKSNRSSDFGYGWMLRMADPDIRETVPVADNEAGLGIFAANAYFAGTRVYLTDPDGERLGFTFTPKPSSCLIGACFLPEFTPDPGVHAELHVDPVTLSQRSDGSMVLYLVGFNYNPRAFRLTLLNGDVIEYDQFDGIQSITDRNQNVLSFADDGITHSDGARIKFERDSLGRITSIEAPTRQTVTYSYDAAGNLVSVFDEANNETRFEYLNDPAHYLSSYTDPLGREVQRMEYDADGRVVAIIDGEGDRVELAWDPASFTGVYRDARGNETLAGYDPRGNKIYERAPDATETQWSYDSDDNLVSYELPNGYVWTATYNANGQWVTQSGPDDREFSRTFNAECDEIDSFTDSEGGVFTFEYDAACNLVRIEDPEDGISLFTYDSNGNVESFTDPAGAQWTFEYNDLGLGTRVVNPAGNERVYAYDGRGLLTRQTDAEGRRITYAYNSRGLLTRESWNGFPITRFDYTYNAADELTSVEGQGVVMNQSYWDDGTLRSVDYAGTTGAPALALAYQNAAGDPGYDPDGNVTEVHDSALGVTQYEYDTLSRLVGMTQTDAAERSARFAYDAGGVLEEIQRFADAGGLSGTVNTGFSYACAGCVQRVAAIEHVQAGSLSDLDSHLYAYDQADNVVTISDSEGVHSIAYDALNRILSIDRDLGSIMPDESYSYDPAGNRLSSHLSTEYRYSGDLGEPGNKLRMTDEDTLSYDADGRLILIERLDDTQTAFSYDNRGRTTRIRTIDGVGAVLNDLEFGYDPFDRRIRITENGVDQWVLHDDENPILIVDSAGNPVERRLYSRKIDDLMAVSDAAGVTQWVLKDRVGNVRALAGNDGVLNGRLIYDGFGRLLGNTLSAVPRLAFNARSFDSVSGVGYFRARDYVPEYGIFAETDPLYPFAYRFAAGNPLKFTDPYGLAEAIENVVINSRREKLIQGICNVGAAARKAAFMHVVHILLTTGSAAGLGPVGGLGKGGPTPGPAAPSAPVACGPAW